MKFIDEVARKYTESAKKTVRLLGNLNLVIVIVLVTSLSTAYSLNKTLEKCQKNYSTIGIVEYLGKNYPELNEVDPEIDNAREDFEKSIDLNNQYLIDYQPYNIALGYFGDNQLVNNKSAVETHAVLLVKISHARTNREGEDNSYYYGTCIEELFSTKDAFNKMMVIESEDYELKDDHYYLIHGTYFYTGAYLSISVSDFLIRDIGENVCLKDVTTTNGYDISDLGLFKKMIDTYQILKNTVEVISVKNAKDDYCFQNGLLNLIDGDYYQDSGCLISQRISDYYNLQVGDKIKLDLVTRENCFINEAFYIDEGFDRSIELEISGIFNENETYNNRIYISEVNNYDMTISNTNYTLGSLKVENGHAQDYLDSAKVPSGFRITFYDQGYLAISSSLSSILRMVYIIALISILCCLAFFVLYGYLLVYKQAGISRNMVRMGTENSDIFRYFQTITLRICLVRNVVALGIGHLLTIGISYGLGYLLTNIANTGILYSNSSLSKSQSLFDLGSEPSIVFALLVGVIALLLAMLSTYIFTVVSFKKEQHGNRIKHLVKAKSHSLKGGSFKYSYLSMIRGGIRTFIPVILIACCGILFSQLQDVTTDTKTQLGNLRSNTSVLGYFTDIYGQKLNNLVVKQDEINVLEQQEYISQLAKYRSAPYEFKYCIKKDGSLVGPGFNMMPKGGFAKEQYLEHLVGSNKIMSTNSIANSVDFLYSDSFKIDWLEGYDESSLSNINNELICVVPNKLAKEYNIELGDKIIVETVNSFMARFGFEDIKWLEMNVVGIFYDDGSCNNLYTDKYFITSERIEVHSKEYYLEGFKVIQDFKYSNLSSRLSYVSVTFKVDDCTHLSDLKSILLEEGYSQPNIIRTYRAFITFNDASYLANERSITQRLWYMQILFPMIYLGCFVICFIVSYSNINSRKKEFKIMHSLGTSASTIFSSIFLEQLIMAVIGASLGLLIIYLLKVQSSVGMALLAISTISYLAGSIIGIKKNMNIQRKVRGEL